MLVQSEESALWMLLSSNTRIGRPMLGIPTLDALAIQSADWTSNLRN
jgi:hypothetical protein